LPLEPREAGIFPDVDPSTNMEWFRTHFPSGSASLPVGAEWVAEVLDLDLPCIDGLVVGCLGARRAGGRDGLVACSAPDVECDVLLQRSLLLACGAAAGDLLAFRIRRDSDEKPFASAPVWKQVAGPTSRSSSAGSGSFPPYVGRVQRISPSGDCACIESPQAQQLHGKELFVSKALLGEHVTVGDCVAFDIRVNSKGNPQAMAPLFRLCSETVTPSTGQLATSRMRPERTAKAFCKKLQDCSMIADWAALPSELVPRTLATAGPVELCRLTAVCRSWKDAIHQAEVCLGEFWHALCSEQFPSMTAKILASPLDHPGRSSPEEEDEQVSSAAFASPARLPLEPPRHAEELGGPSVGRASDGHFWREKFAQRFSRQRAWDAQRQEQLRSKLQRGELHRQQATTEDKQRSQNFRSQTTFSESTTQRTLRSLRSVRAKHCRRCAAEYLPSDTAPDACRWHRGQYFRVDADGMLENAAPSDVRAVQKAVQQAIKANGRKKKSRQPNMIVPGFSQAHRSEQSWAWSCCGAESMVSPGCACGPHS